MKGLPKRGGPRPATPALPPPGPSNGTADVRYISRTFIETLTLYLIHRSRNLLRSPDLVLRQFQPSHQHPRSLLGRPLKNRRLRLKHPLHLLPSHPLMCPRQACHLSLRSPLPFTRRHLIATPNSPHSNLQQQPYPHPHLRHNPPPNPYLSLPLHLAPRLHPPPRPRPMSQLDRGTNYLNITSLFADLTTLCLSLCKMLSPRTPLLT